MLVLMAIDFGEKLVLPELSEKISSGCKLFLNNF